MIWVSPAEPAAICPKGVAPEKASAGAEPPRETKTASPLIFEG